MWIDWQQGGKLGGCEGGKQNPTLWLQKLRVTNPIRQKQVEKLFFFLNFLLFHYFCMFFLFFFTLGLLLDFSKLIIEKQ